MFSKWIKVLFATILVGALSSCTSGNDAVPQIATNTFPPTIAPTATEQDELIPREKESTSTLITTPTIGSTLPLWAQDLLEEKALVISFYDDSLKTQIIDLVTKQTLKELDINPNSIGSTLYWSPNGKYIAYQDYIGGVSKIFLVGVLTQEKILVRSDDIGDVLSEYNFTGGDWISWAPDSSMFAFESVVGETEDIFIYHIEEQILQNITNHPAQDFALDFSPDGELILFISNRGEINQMYSITPDGSEVIQISHFTEYSHIFNPTWSPDGQKIGYRVFPIDTPILGNLNATPELFVMDLDGSNVTLVLGGEDYSCHWCEEVTWAPDSQSVLTWYHDGMDFDMFLIPLDTGEIQQLSSDEPNINQGGATWLSEDALLFFEFNQQYKEDSYYRICVTKIDDWQCEEVLNITDEGTVWQWGVIPWEN